jgi:hypothetical protein
MDSTESMINSERGTHVVEATFFMNFLFVFCLSLMSSGFLHSAFAHKYHRNSLFS